MSGFLNLDSGGVGPSAYTAYTYPYVASGPVSVGDVVYLSGPLQISRSSASQPATVPPLGIVTGTSGSKYAVASASQVATGLSGLVTGTYYFLSSSPGAYTDFPPSTNRYLVGRALSTTSMLILTPQTVTDPGPTGPGSNFLGASGPTGIASSAIGSSYFYLLSDFQGFPAGSEVISRNVLSSDLSLIGGTAYCTQVATAQTVLTIQKGIFSAGVLGYTNIGTITYEANDVLGTVVLSSGPVSCLSGQLIRVINQVSSDLTFGGPYFTFYGNLP